MPLTDVLDSNRTGLRVLGDVHGHARPFRAAIAEADRCNRAVLSLGDIISRGPDIPGAMELAAALVEDGRGAIVPGNHEARLLRWSRGDGDPRLRRSLAETLDQLAAHPRGGGILDRFLAAIVAMPVWRRAGRILFVHGGARPAMLDAPAPLLGDADLASDPVETALNGETDGTITPQGFYRRTYRWLDTMPPGVTVYIGHHVVSMDGIVERYGARGARVVHLDTGSGLGGRLSWIDLPAAALSAAPCNARDLDSAA